MEQLRTLTRGLAVDHGAEPSDVIRQLDRCMSALGIDALATIIYATIHAEGTGDLLLRWCSAGHLPLVVLAADGQATTLPTANDLLLGIDPAAVRKDLSVRLPLDSTLLLYSDGLVETRTQDLDHGVDRLRSAAQQWTTAGVVQLSDLLLSAMVGPHPPDDVALLVIRAQHP